MNKLINLIAVLVVSFFVFLGFGCAWINQDASIDAKLWGGYEYQGRYQLLLDVFLIKTFSDGLVLVPASSYHLPNIMRIHMSPNSISQYKKDPDKGSWYISEQPHPGSSHMIKHKVRVVGIVEKGTIIQCTKLTKRTTWVLGHGFNTRVTPYALITSGSFSKTTVNILSISAIDLEKSSDTVLFTPAPFVLAKEAI